MRSSASLVRLGISIRSISSTSVAYKKAKMSKILPKPNKTRAPPRDMTRSMAEGLAAVDQLVLKAQQGGLSPRWEVIPMYSHAEKYCDG